MIINDLDLMGIAFPPSEADAPLIVDTDTVLPFAVAYQLLQAVGRGDAQVVERFRSIQEQEFSQRRPAQRPGEPRLSFAEEDALGLLVAEAADHASMITLRANNVKRYEVREPMAGGTARMLFWGAEALPRQSPASRPGTGTRRAVTKHASAGRAPSLLPGPNVQD